MRVKNLIATILIQAIGAGAALLSALLITRTMGLQAQGEYSLLKSWTDAGIVIFLYGLPQSFLDISFKKHQSELSLYKIANRYFTYLIIVGVSIGLLGFSYGQPFLIPLSIPFFVYHGLIRSLLLRTDGEVTYALITVVPAISLCILIYLDFYHHNFSLYIFLSALLSAITAWRVALRQRWQGDHEISFKAIAMHSMSFHSFLLNVLPAMQSAAFLTLAAMMVSSKSEVGELSLVLLMLQSVAIAASFAAPPLYRFFDPDNFTWKSISEKKKYIIPFFMGSTVALVTTSLLMPIILKNIFNVYSENLAYACQIGLLAGVFLFLSRLLGTVFQKMGFFSKLSLSGILRLVMSLVLFWILKSTIGLEISIAGSLALLVSEAIIFSWFFLLALKSYENNIKVSI